MITKEDLKNEGFEVSLNLDQQTITRAESDIEEAYIKPIIKDVDMTLFDACTLKKARLNLTFLTLLSRSLASTRAGAKMKISTSSSIPNPWDSLGEVGSVCDFYLHQLKKQSGKSRVKVNDILKIYFRTNFIDF